MKKIWMLMFIAALLFSSSPVFAKTTLERTEKENGKISLVLTTTDTMDVRALQLSLKIEGNVDAESFEWSSQIKSSYTRKVVYNNTNHTVNIVIATGNQENIIAEDGTIHLGTLTFIANTTPRDKYYDVKLNDEKENYLQLMSASYTTLVPSDVENIGGGAFKLQAKKVEEPKDDSTTSDDKDQSQSNDSTVSVKKPSTNQSSSSDSVKEDSKKEESNKDVEIFDKEQNDNKEKESVKENSFDYWNLVLVVCVIALIGIGFYLYSNRPRRMQP